MTGDTVDKIKKGVKETLGGVKEGVEDTAHDVKEGVEDTAEGVKDTAEDVVVPETYNESGGKGPMNPEDIASHEPTAVKRDKKQGTSGDPV